MKTINDLKYAYFEAKLGVSGLAKTLTDLEYEFYSNPPEGVAVADATDAADVIIQFNALLDSLRAAKVISSV